MCHDLAHRERIRILLIFQSLSCYRVRAYNLLLLAWQRVKLTISVQCPGQSYLILCLILADCLNEASRTDLVEL